MVTPKETLNPVFPDTVFLVKGSAGETNRAADASPSIKRRGCVNNTLSWYLLSSDPASPSVLCACIKFSSTENAAALLIYGVKYQIPGEVIVFGSERPCECWALDRHDAVPQVMKVLRVHVRDSFPDREVESLEQLGGKLQNLSDKFFGQHRSLVVAF